MIKEFAIKGNVVHHAVAVIGPPWTAALAAQHD
jgi:large-conductance mechanosensitive channel